MGNRAAMYKAVTRSIRVTVQPVYLEGQSSPADRRFVWAYHVLIENLGDATVQLRSRYWRIFDSLGNVREVRGVGVVEEQPILKPGQQFEYTSASPLSTPSGIMVGSYQMETIGGETFDVAIPAFSLDSPHEQKRLH